MTRYLKYTIAFVFLFMMYNSLFAQSYGKIVGSVTDKNTGEVLTGANVYLEGTALGASTDIDGVYIILRIPPGKYKVTVEYLGYQKVTYENVEVLIDLSTPLNFDIEQEAFEGEEIVVIAQAPLIRKDLTSVEARVQADEIKHMAVQEIGDLISMQAGVVKGSDGAIHIRGGRSTEIAYLVNGISMTDDFSRNQSFQIENESIQELQVISGTFNAEYGNAMSGIVNIVTKTGSDKFEADLEVWSGDYVSSRDDIFWNIDDVDPFTNYNIQGSFSGPIIPQVLNFYVTARRYYSDGYLYGPRMFLPQLDTLRLEGELYNIPTFSDSTAIPMNSNERNSMQATLSWNIINELKLKMDFFGHMEERRNYDHAYRILPTGDRGDIDEGFSLSGKFTHTISTSTYQEFIFGYNHYNLTSKLYDKFDDPRYVAPDAIFVRGPNTFNVTGNDVGRFTRTSQSRILKYEITSQFGKHHQVKTGLETSFDKVDYFDANLSNVLSFPQFIAREDTVQDFKREPFKFSAYLQDKIEFNSLVVNVGLRFDYFDPNGRVPKDSEDPSVRLPQKLINKYKDINNDGVINPDEQTEANRYSVSELEDILLKDTKVKTLISPRLGLAFPISDEGVLHFSYGIFQQIPEYSQLYISDRIPIGEAAGTYGPYGNPDLEPQKTTMYELGIQQQLTEDLSIDITGYYRDIRDWVSTSQPFKTVIGNNYVVFTNRDFANVRGITLSVTKRFADHFAFNLDYTYQVAEGTNSNPDQEYFAQQGGAEPTKILTPLNWDQRHTLNWNIFVGGEKWGVDLISRFNTGQPYTPSAIEGTRSDLITSGSLENSREKPVQFTMDVNSFYNFNFDGYSFQVYAKIYNLLDAGNPNTVFDDTGEPDVYLRDKLNLVDSDPTYFVRPDYYSPPRRFVLGLKIRIF